MHESASDAVKSKLKETTEYCWKDLGAYGCPWFWVTNDNRRAQASHSSEDEGTTQNQGLRRRLRTNPDRPGEPFFGSDRWHFMWDFLDIPWQDVTILSPLRSRTEIKGKEPRSKL